MNRKDRDRGAEMRLTERTRKLILVLASESQYNATTSNTSSVKRIKKE